MPLEMDLQATEIHIPVVSQLNADCCASEITKETADKYLHTVCDEDISDNTSTYACVLNTWNSCTDGMDEHDSELQKAAEAALGEAENHGDSDSEENEFEIQDHNSSSTDPNQMPIYPGAPISVALSMLLVLSFTVSHELTGEAINDLLTLMSMHFIQPVASKAFQSLHMFKKHFQCLKNPIVYHRYCSFCYNLLNSDVINKVACNEVVKCPNIHCTNTDLTVSGAVAFFIEIPIASQIIEMFSRDSFTDDLKYRFQRVKKHPCNIEDIYDGACYKHCFLLQNPQNISLMWNTDGVPVFKSSGFSLWPLYFTVNELSPKLRQKKENMIFAGLWFGVNKPYMMTYLKPFHTSLKLLETEGVNVCSPKEGQFNSKVVLLLGTADLPAKCLVMNMVQFNGEYGCSKCLQPGSTVRTDKGGHVHVYPFISHNPKGPARTHKGFMKDALTAYNSKNRSNGVNGPSWFGALQYFDLIHGVSVDYMHNMSGMMKKLLTFWFGAENSSEPYSLSRSVSQVDQRLKQIKPTADIQRTPRSIEEHRNYFKASELKNLLLYYGPVILFGILDTNYFTHFLMLSEAYHILLQSSISPADLDLAEKLLYHFCIKFDHYYGARHYTANIHNLVHLCDNVRDAGPLWAFSCFPFEDKNGFLLKLFHGTQNVAFQIVSAAAISQKLPELVKSSLVTNSKEWDFYCKLTKVRNPQNKKQIAPGIFVVSRIVQYNLNTEEYAAVVDCCGAEFSNTVVCSFTRIRKNGELFHSMAYCKPQKRISYTVSLQGVYTGNYAKIHLFCQVQLSCTSAEVCGHICKCPKTNLAIVRMVETDTAIQLSNDTITNCTATHVKPMKKTCCPLVAIPIENIDTKCILLEFTDDCNLPCSFICTIANTLENE